MSEHAPRHEEFPHERLRRILDRDREELETLTSQYDPLTIERIGELDPRFTGQALHIRNNTALQWPEKLNAVPLSLRTPSHDFVGRGADERFLEPIVEHGNAAYNNYWALLAAKPQLPSEEASLWIAQHNMNEIYGTAPYLHRARALFPEFMDALHDTVRVTGRPQDFTDLLKSAKYDKNPDSEAWTLLTGSRLAYCLMARLMRRDDNKIQLSMLGWNVQNISMIESPDAQLTA